MFCDYDEYALYMMKQIYENWDGTNYKNFIKKVDVLHNCKEMASRIDFDKFIEFFGKEDDWLSWFNTHFTGVVTDKISQFPKKIDISYMATDTHTTYSVYAPLEILWHKQNNELEHLMDYFYKCCYGSKIDKLFKNITII